MNRLVAAALGAVVVGVALAGAAAAASAQTPEPQPTLPPGVLQYAGVVESVSTDPSDGETRVDEPVESVAWVVCDEDGCVAARTQSGEDGIPLDDGAGTLSAPATGSVCGEGEYRGARTETVTATAETLTWVVDAEWSGKVMCPEGESWVWALHWEFEGELVAGDPCVLDGSCVVAEEDCCVSPGAPRPFTAPTVLSGVATAAEAARPGNLLWAALGTVVLALLIAIPTHFFNSAAETVTDRVGAWWRARRRREIPARGLTRWPVAAGGVLAAATISAFADPAFGFDAAGLRVLLSIVVAFGIEVALGWVAVILVVRRTHPTAVATIRFAPLTLLLVAAAMLVTRLTGFEPAIVFGLVAGVAFGGLLGAAEQARVALIGLGWSFGIGLLAWGGYSVATAVGGDTVLRELLATAAIAGISTLPIALLPLRGLTGRTVWEASRVVWGIAYAIGLFAFLLVLLPLPASWAEVGVGLWTWIGLYVLYAAAGVAAWLIATRPWRGARAADPSDA